MKASGMALLVAVATIVPSHGRAIAESPHPLTYWVRASIDPTGPAAWSITLRTGGYFTGYALWVDGEFNGQLSAAEREELSRALDRLPQSDRSYHFGTERPEGPALVLELQHPAPTKRYRVASVGDGERSDPRLEFVADVADLLLRLVPQAKGRAATPWRQTVIDVAGGRTRG
jgi:hypothetical protein